MCGAWGHVGIFWKAHTIPELDLRQNFQRKVAKTGINERIEGNGKMGKGRLREES